MCCLANILAASGLLAALQPPSGVSARARSAHHHIGCDHLLTPSHATTPAATTHPRAAAGPGQPMGLRSLQALVGAVSMELPVQQQQLAALKRSAIVLKTQLVKPEDKRSNRDGEATLGHVGDQEGGRCTPWCELTGCGVS